jgi:hypothetical protein
MLPELQVPHAPCPAVPHGPQELPQQNHDISPYSAMGYLSFMVEDRVRDRPIDVGHYHGEEGRQIQAIQ